MPTTARPAPDVQELLAAYRTLGLAPQASPVAVRTRYRELTQVADAARVREINAAYELVEDAPLEYREIPVEPASEPVDAPPRRPHWLERVDINPRVCIGLWLGMGTGATLADWLGGPFRDPLYGWLVAIAMGLLFARSSPVANLLLGEIVSALRMTRRG